MADSLDFRFVNARNAKVFFKRLGTELTQRAAVVAVRAGMKPIFVDMVRRAPERTGNLKSALKVVIKFLKRKGMATASAGPTKKGSHAVFLEFGTKNMPAQPFMRPAVDAKHRESTRIVFNVYERFIKRAARKGIK